MPQSVSNRVVVQGIGDLTLASHVLGISEQMVQDLDACVYTHDLLHSSLAERLGGKLPSSLTISQSYILRQKADELSVLVIRIGCVVQAHAILGLVDGGTVRDLAQLTTPYLMQDAAWKPAFSIVADIPYASPVALAEEIKQSGCRVLHAWCEAQPTSVALRVRCFLPDPPAVSSYVPMDTVHMVDVFVAERLGDD